MLVDGEHVHVYYDKKTKQYTRIRVQCTKICTIPVMTRDRSEDTPHVMAKDQERITGAKRYEENQSIMKKGLSVNWRQPIC